MNHEPGFSTPITAAIAAEIIVVVAIFVFAAILTNISALQ
jgi:hypothetical protein